MVPHSNFDLHFSNKLAMLSIFSCASQPSVCLLWRNVYRSSAYFLIGLFGFLLLACMSCVYLEIKSLLIASFANIFSPVCGLSFGFYLWFPLIRSYLFIFAN